MKSVLIVAADACVRLTCAEVMAHAGFCARAAAPAELPAIAEEPDAVLVWPGAGEMAVRDVRAAYPGTAVLVCSWDSECAWPGVDAVVRLPFAAERVALTLLKTLRERKPARTVAA